MTGRVLQLVPQSKSAKMGRPGKVVTLLTATPLIRDTLMTELDMFVKLGNGPSRNQMYLLLAWTMQLNGLRKVDLGPVILRYEPNKWLSIKAKQINNSNFCPGCGQYIYSDNQVRLLQFEGDTGWHHYGCRCRTYFKKLEGYDCV